LNVKLIGDGAKVTGFCAVPFFIYARQPQRNYLSTKYIKKNGRTQGSGNCLRDALTVGKQNFPEILRSPIPITVSRVEGQDAAGRRLFNLY